ncbi:BTB/POZ domain-containing protein 6 isoform X3 [Aquarana catesbeiana]|uniref:BTB/POZ domain-containing protein 6 isoform X3 n=1 Tax=Aquarana catesbeiana TaxID=8400 RepID=UPI003CC9DBB0
MPVDPGCLDGRIMKCLTFFLLLPETFKKSKKSGGRAGGKVQACYEIVPLALKRKMAAELYPAQHTDIPDNATAKKNALHIPPHSSPPPPPLHNLNNNHIDTDHWQSSHPTLRERYLYSDEIDLEADTVLATLYAAKKYIVPALAKACVNFLETSLEAKNACVLLSQSRLFEEPELTLRCWEVIDAQAELALKSEGFCEIDLPTLEIIVTRETLNTKEDVVFEAVVSWADAECKRQGLPATPTNKRNVLGKALYLVRIPTMTLEEFANGAAQSDILTLEETRSIFLWYTAANKPQLEFPLVKRKGLAPQRCHRFQSSAYRSNQWRYRGRCDSIQFAVDKRIFIGGLGLYGSSCGKAEYSVKIELKRQGVVLAQNLTKFVSDGSSNTFSVWFEHPVQVEQDTFYTVSAILDGNELSYFGQEGMTEVQCGKVTFQFQCSSDSTNGTGVQGGQIPELIFYA